MAEKKKYVTLVEGFVHGEHRKKNAELELTDREAKYLVLNGHVEAAEEKKEKPPKEEPDPATMDRKTR